MLVEYLVETVSPDEGVKPGSFEQENCIVSGGIRKNLNHSQRIINVLDGVSKRYQIWRMVKPGLEVGIFYGGAYDFDAAFDLIFPARPYRIDSDACLGPVSQFLQEEEVIAEAAL